MLGAHINPMLDFRENFIHITKDVKKLANVLAKRKLSPPTQNFGDRTIPQIKIPRHAPWSI